jgi:DNA-binding MarR family transcriptional regulator
MHAVTFATKRAHLGGVAFGKKVVKKVHGMTPARFDLMYVIRTAYGRCVTAGRAYFLRQDTLRKRLGLHPSTVSKMIKRLIEIGWLEKERRPVEDARTNIIQLTRKGLKAIKRAMRIVGGPRPHELREDTHFFHFEFLFGKMHPRRWATAAVAEFFEYVDAVARSFGDESNVEYDFGFSDH